jgi:hypothetical protein
VKVPGLDPVTADLGLLYGGDAMHRDLFTGTDTTGTVDLGPEGAVALIERTS